MPEEFEFEPPRKQGKFRNFASAHRQAWRDVKKRGRRGLVWVIFLIVFFGLIKSLQVLLSDPTIIIDNINTACRPDDSFTIGSDAYNWWRARGFFDITMGYGKMTFAQAKAVDVAWDVFVGRGGQALLAVISWRVFAKYVTTSIAVTPVTFSTFRTVFLHNEATIGSISQFIGDFSRRHGLRSKAAMVFMIVTMMFILAFPTFGGAMTGYKGNVESFVQDRSGNLLPFTSFKYVHYIIHDGDRIGKGQRYMVSAPNPPTDVVDNGLNGSKASPSKFMEIDLPSPVLNIEPIYLPYSYLNNFNWDNSTLGTPSVMSWEASSVLYNSTYVEEQGSCQPLKVNHTDP
ncbi:hypothetical protein GQ44DRAFT_605883 [Phaeosphaeriaceae sp. PMI808]|nr:hypothetical protein GQ44DRAFT_605883 [Phaeosphaeriaceae sp. PMI808]